MAEARFVVRFAGPFVSFQDGGRLGHMRFGVPRSGPMDRLAMAAANSALGNPSGATAIEVSMGGLMLECTHGSITVGIAGGAFSIEHGGSTTTEWSVRSIQAGEKLALRAGPSGSWCYLAFTGNLITEQWLDHSATHSISGFGGGSLRAGQTISVENAEIREDREGSILRPTFLPETGPIRVVMGPQDRHFQPGALSDFTGSEFSLTDAFDRMGVRLSGPKLPLAGALSIPSEPVTRGSIQVAGDGGATILLADHQTTGGYPKIATVISPDLDRVAQMRARDPLRFSAIPPELAVQLARQHFDDTATYLGQVAQPKGSLAQRLMHENLISGVMSAEMGN